MTSDEARDVVTRLLAHASSWKHSMRLSPEEADAIRALLDENARLAADLHATQVNMEADGLKCIQCGVRTVHDKGVAEHWCDECVSEALAAERAAKEAALAEVKSLKGHLKDFGEAYQQAIRERDEAAVERLTGNVLAWQKQAADNNAATEQALRERDEALAENERLTKETEDCPTLTQLAESQLEGYRLANAELRTMLDAERRRLADALTAATKERDALAAFKAFVHRRLDEAGIPTHPDGPHSAAGCRIGDRLDIALAAWQQQSTRPCPTCSATGAIMWPSEDGGSPPMECPECDGTGKRVGTELTAERAAKEAAERQYDDCRTLLDLCCDAPLKLEVMTKCAEQAIRERDEARAEVARLEVRFRERRDLYEGEYWSWQGDGHGYLESLTCDILIKPDAMRQLLKERDEARAELTRQRQTSFDAEHALAEALDEALDKATQERDEARQARDWNQTLAEAEKAAKEQIIGELEQARQRAERAEAGAAALTKAAGNQELLMLIDYIAGSTCSCDPGVGMAPCEGCTAKRLLRNLRAALATDAGKPLLEELERLRAALERIGELPHSNPTGDTLHGPCPRCIAEAALTKEPNQPG